MNKQEIEKWFYKQHYQPVMLQKGWKKIIGSKNLYTEDVVIELLQKLSDLNQQENDSRLGIADVMVSACKGGYLLKNNDCKKYGGVCVKHNCDYWQAEP